MVLDQQLLILILGLLGALVLVLALCVAFLVYKLLKDRAEPRQQSEPAAAPKTPDEADGEVDPTLMMCINHPERQAQGICAISQDPICETCLREDDGLVISVDHFRTYLQANWVLIEKIKATPDDTTASAHLYSVKNRLWASGEIPTLVSTHYKIDVDTDMIESHIHFLVREQEREQLINELAKERRQAIPIGRQ